MEEWRPGGETPSESCKTMCEDTAKAPEWEKKAELATNREEGIVDFHSCCERSCF